MMDEEYHLNWLRGGIALIYAKKGLERFVNNKTADFHERLHEEVYRPYSRNGPVPNHSCNLQFSSNLLLCITCTPKDVQRHNNTWRVKCQTGACSCKLPSCCNSWLKVLLNYNADPRNLVPVNFEPTKLALDSFEVAKFFMPTGSSGYKNSQDADPYSLFKLLNNCFFFLKHLKKESALVEVIKIRCRLMHSNCMRVDNAQLARDIKKVIEMLEDLIDLTPEESADVQAAIAKIRKVQTKTFGWVQKKEFQAIESLMKDLDADVTNRLNTQDSDLQDLQDKAELTSTELQTLNSSFQQTKQDVDGLKTFMTWFWRMTGVEKIDETKIHQISSIFSTMEDKLQEHKCLIQQVKRNAKLLKKHDAHISEIHQQLVVVESDISYQFRSLEIQGSTIDRQNEEVMKQKDSLDSLEQQMMDQSSNIKRQDSRLDEFGEKQCKQEQKLAEHDMLLGQMSTTSEPQDLMPADMNMVVEKQASKTMQILQADIAKYLEIAFLSVSDYPDLSREIRLTSVEARTLHQKTLGLMKKFYSSAENILDMLIPMIQAAVDLQDESIIREVYVQILQTSTIMKAETANTRDRCESVQTKIGQNINLVEVAKARERQNAAEVEEALSQMWLRKRSLAEQVQEIETEKQEHERRLQDCIIKMDASIRQQDLCRNDVQRSKVGLVVLGVLAVPLAVLAGPGSIGSLGWSSFCCGGSYLLSNHKLKQSLDEFDELSDKKDKSWDRLAGVKRTQRETASNLSEATRRIQSLTQKEKAIISNITSLQDAYSSMLQVDCQLTKLTQFWEDMSVVISYVHDKTSASQTFARELKDPKYAEQFLKFVTKAEKSWIQFQAICKDYVSSCGGSSDQGVDRLYGFLFTPVDSIPRTQRKARQNTLIDQINNKTPPITFY